MQSDKEKAAEIQKKRRLAAKGLKERKDGKPIDPMEDIGTLKIDTDPDQPETPLRRTGTSANAVLPSASA